MTTNFKDLGIKADTKGFTGPKIKINKILNKPITVNAFKVKPSNFEGKGNCLHLDITVGDSQHVVFTGSSVLAEMINQVPKSAFPFATTIVEENDRFIFT